MAKGQAIKQRPHWGTVHKTFVDRHASLLSAKAGWVLISLIPVDRVGCVSSVTSSESVRCYVEAN